jgi:hypothetical protein
VIAVAAGSMAGCGGASSTHTSSTAPAASRPQFVAGAELERELGNDFRHGLYRLAVMSQPPDDATDLGQSLPTGLLRTIACSARGAQPAAAVAWSWRCDVQWETAGGAPRRTRYAVRLLPTGCFAAAADPGLPAHRDTTIASYSEHPLNALVSVRKGC